MPLVLSCLGIYAVLLAMMASVERKQRQVSLVDRDAVINEHDNVTGFSSCQWR